MNSYLRDGIWKDQIHLGRDYFPAGTTHTLSNLPQGRPKARFGKDPIAVKTVLLGKANWGKNRSKGWVAVENHDFLLNRRGCRKPQRAKQFLGDPTTSLARV